MTMTDQDHTQRFETPSAPPQPPDPVEAASGAPGTPSPADTPPTPSAFADPEAVPTTPVAPVTAAGPARGSRSRVRWLAALVVTVVVVGLAAGATLLLTSDSGDPAVLAYAPKDSLVYSELRLDLPGSQQAQLAKLMTAFPGFDDQAAFPTKLNEALDQILGKATNGTQSWATDIDPWFGRQVSVSVGPFPATAAAAASAHGLVLLSVKDAPKAEGWAAALVTREGATTTTESYNGVTITSVTPKDGAPAGMADVHTAYAVIGPVLALGDVASVKAAIDTKGTAGLNTVAQFKTAEASVSGDRLGFGYVDAKGLSAAAKDLAGGAASAMPSLPAAFSDLAPAWTVGAIRAQDGGFVIDTRNPHVAKLGPATTAETTLASILPPTTVALAEGHDVGAALTRIKDLAATDPELAKSVKDLESSLRIVGGWDAITGWMGEAGIAVTRDGDTIGGGIVVVPTDRAAAERLLTQLRGFIELAGGTSGLKVTDEAYADATITVVDLGNLGDLAGAATGGAVEAPANLQISYTVTDQAVVIGYGTGFTKAVLDARTGDSLAKSDRFAAALKQAGSRHASLFWVDVAGIRSHIEGMIPAADKADYEANAKPYLDAFDSIIGSYVPGEELDRGTVIIHVTGS